MIHHKKKKSNKKHLITVFILLGLIVFSSKNPETMRWPSNVFNLVLTPVNRAVYAVSNSIEEAMTSIFGSKKTNDDVARLELELKASKDQLRQLKKIVDDRDYLKAEYEILKSSRKDMVQSYLVAMDSYRGIKRFTIDQGSLKGVEVNDSVIQGVVLEGGLAIEALVGRITEVGPNYSKVSAILDDSNDLSFRISKNKEIGVITEREGKYLYGYTLDKDADVSVGDEISTSGIGGIFPAEIYIGKVIDIEKSKDGLTNKLTIESPVDFSKLYRVIIIKTQEAKNE